MESGLALVRGSGSFPEVFALKSGSGERAKRTKGCEMNQEKGELAERKEGHLEDPERAREPTQAIGQEEL